MRRIDYGKSLPRSTTDPQGRWIKMKTGYGLLSWGLAGALSLAGCQAPSGPSDMAGDATSKGRLQDDSLGYSLAAPAGWTAYGKGSPPLRMTMVRNEFQDFQPTVNVVASPYPPGMSMGNILKAMAEAKFQEYGSTFELMTEDTLALAGRTAGFLKYGMERQGVLLVVEQAALLHRESLLLFTFMDKRSTFADRWEEFESIRNSLVLE